MSNHAEDRGMTKREYIATQIMASVIVKAEARTEADLPFLFQKTAEMSVQAADALLRELGR